MKLLLLVASWPLPGTWAHEPHTLAQGWARSSASPLRPPASPASPSPRFVSPVHARTQPARPVGLCKPSVREEEEGNRHEDLPVTVLSPRHHLAPFTALVCGCEPRTRVASSSPREARVRPSGSGCGEASAPRVCAAVCVRVPVSRRQLCSAPHVPCDQTVDSRQPVTGPSRGRAPGWRGRVPRTSEHQQGQQQEHV